MRHDRAWRSRRILDVTVFVCVELCEWAAKSASRGTARPGVGKEKVWVVEGKGERQRAQATINRLELQVEMRRRGRLICARTIEIRIQA